jgi:threonine dehydrogenase-like Zn-dependent dehydrogenase
VVVGAGTIGLLLLQAARRSGAATVAVVEPDAQRRQFARTFGADTVASCVEELMDGRDIGFEYAIEASGTAGGASAAVSALCRGGTMLVFGVAPDDVALPVSQFRTYNDELTILGSMAVLASFEASLQVAAAGSIDVDRMVTHTFALEQFSDAVEAARSRAGLKVQIHSSV